MMLEGAVWRTARVAHRCDGNGAAHPAHAAACSLVIRPGDRYVEYLGESPAFASGSHHCEACASAFGYVR